MTDKLVHVQEMKRIATPIPDSKISMNEAFYIVQGSSQTGYKIIQESIPSSNMPNEPLMIDPLLLQMELKFDTLKQFLESITIAVNQHANIINKLQNHNNNNNNMLIYQKQIKDTLEKISQSITFNNPDLLTVLNTQLETNPNNKGTSIEDITTRLCNRIYGYNQAISNIYQKTNDYETVINRLDNDLVEKVQRDEFKAKFKKNKLKVHNKLEEIKESIENKIVEVESKLIDKMEGYELKICEVEKNTLWKIKDCEELLKVRASKEYVKDSIRSLEDRIHTHITKSNQSQIYNLDRISDEITSKMQTLETSQKRFIKDMENEFSKKVSTSKFEEFTRETNHTLAEALKKLEPIHTEQKIFENTISQMQAKLELMSLSSAKGTGLELSENDFLKLSEYERQILGLTNDVERLNQITAELQDAISKRPDNTELSTILQDKIGKDDVVNIINEIISSDDKLATKMSSKEVTDLYKKMDLMHDVFDKKIKRMGKETDFTVLLRQIKGKAEEEEVKKGFTNVDAKLSAISELMSMLKKETELSANAIKIIKNQLKLQDFSMFKPKTNTKNDSHYMPPLNSAKGTDGKIYRTDHKMNSSMIDSHTNEDYDIDIFNNDSKNPRQRDELKNLSSYTDSFSQKGSRTSKPDNRMPSPMKIITPEKSFHMMGIIATTTTPLMRQSDRPSSAKNSIALL